MQKKQYILLQTWYKTHHSPHRIFHFSTMYSMRINTKRNLFSIQKKPSRRPMKYEIRSETHFPNNQYHFFPTPHLAYTNKAHLISQREKWRSIRSNIKLYRIRLKYETILSMSAEAARGPRSPINLHHRTMKNVLIRRFPTNSHNRFRGEY